jgi:PBP1b-binding outer membrane lipoprotein LpoB
MRTIFLVLVATFFLSGCMEATYREYERHGWQCRPEKTVHGQCVPLAQGAPR